MVQNQHIFFNKNTEQGQKSSWDNKNGFSGLTKHTETEKENIKSLQKTLTNTLAMKIDYHTQKRIKFIEQLL